MTLKYAYGEGQTIERHSSITSTTSSTRTPVTLSDNPDEKMEEVTTMTGPMNSNLRIQKESCEAYH